MFGTAFGLLVQHLAFAGPAGAYGLVGMTASHPATFHPPKPGTTPPPVVTRKGTCAGPVRMKRRIKRHRPRPSEAAVAGGKADRRFAELSPERVDQADGDMIFDSRRRAEVRDAADGDVTGGIVRYQ
jgi:hypothetical protein